MDPHTRGVGGPDPGAPCSGARVSAVTHLEDAQPGGPCTGVTKAQNMALLVPHVRALLSYEHKSVMRPYFCY